MYKKTDVYCNQPKSKFNNGGTVWKYVKCVVRVIKELMHLI